MINLLDTTSSTQGATAIVRSTVPALRRHSMDLADIELQTWRDENASNKRRYVLRAGGETLGYTSRFGTSLLGLLGQGSSVFDLFTPEEVLNRAAATGKVLGGLVTITIATDRNTGEQTALAASLPRKPRIGFSDIADIVSRGLGDSLTGITYDDGVVTLRLNPTTTNPEYHIKGDAIRPQFFVDIPVDGYGNPCAYVGLLRIVCANGMVAMSKHFRSALQVGKGKRGDSAAGADATAASQLKRFMEVGPSEDAYLALRDRIEASASVPASLDEYFRLFSVMAGANNRQGAWIEGIDVAKTFREVGGAALDSYGLTTIDGMDEKLRQRLPVDRCSVYSLFNVASEVASHHTDPGTARLLHGFCGSLISKPYDLEGVLQVGDNKQEVDVYSKLGDAPAPSPETPALALGS